jgi:hypothetical protein
MSGTCTPKRHFHRSLGMCAVWTWYSMSKGWNVSLESGHIMLKSQENDKSFFHKHDGHPQIVIHILSKHYSILELFDCPSSECFQIKPTTSSRTIATWHDLIDLLYVLKKSNRRMNDFPYFLSMWRAALTTMQTPHPVATHHHVRELTSAAEI